LAMRRERLLAPARQQQHLAEPVVTD
jgi:hypothetical protein